MNLQIPVSPMEPRYPLRMRNQDLEIAEDTSNDNENEDDANVGQDGDKDSEDEEEDTDEDDEDEDDEDDDDDEDDEEDEDDEDVEQLPYPGFRPIALRYLDQRSRPRKWCLAMMTNPYPFYASFFANFPTFEVELV